MRCRFCQEETETIIKGCAFIDALCAKCCFHISSGVPAYIDQLKKSTQMMKEEILKRCSECNPVK